MASDRIGALDFAKGALVLLMVVYHVLNYLRYETAPHLYLGFVPASFIMIAGFLVMNVYAGRHGGHGREAAVRLAVRALKLLLIFTALNVLARLVFSVNHYGEGLSIGSFFGEWLNVYVKGDGKAVAFDVLVPIAYTIAFAGVLLWLRSFNETLGAAATILVLAGLVAATLTGRGTPNVNWVALGIVGMLLGRFELRILDDVLGRNRWKLVGLLLMGYGAVVHAGLDTLSSQLAVTVAWLVILYAIGQGLPGASRGAGTICVLGRYSLLAYIAQIAYLQGTPIFVAALPEHAPLREILLCSLIAMLTWGTVVAVDGMRHRVAGVDRLYRFVFA